MTPDGIRKLLVMELAGLGDNVHLLPALWLLRRGFPQASLQVMVSAGCAGLFVLTPWIDRVWAYPGAPKPGLLENLRWGARLRRERFDLVINTTGSDRSSLLTWLSRAPRRYGRVPADGGPPGWRRLYTGTLQCPYYEEPMFRQKWRCIAQLGIAAQAPQFKVAIDPQRRRQHGIDAADEGCYVHVSPFTTADWRELPPAQLAELLARLRLAWPGLRIVLSCAGNARERNKLAALLPLLAEPPWKVFAGTLDLAGLAAVIQASACNLSGDSGPLHLAMMTATPAVAWFCPHKGVREWTPEGPQYRLLVAPGPENRSAPIAGIGTDALVAAVRSVLGHRQQ